VPKILANYVVKTKFYKNTWIIVKFIV